MIRISAFAGLVLLINCTALQKHSSIQNANEPIAFPSAEGFGKFTTGGRGGKVYIVTNLNDSGPGSLREAAEAKTPRIIVFATDGTIHLKSPLRIRKNVTIAGHSAPGDGICIADQPVEVVGDNVVIRYLRFRMGDRYQNKGKQPGGGSDDALNAVNRKHVVIDHCSMSWSTDEAFSIYAGDSVTVQWNIISEPLNYSYHFEAGGSDFQEHGYGGIWGGRHFTAHHNLFAHCNSRNPRFDGIRNSPEENVDFRNNVIYNWGVNNVYAGEGGTYNIVNNYYKYGPSTKESVRFRIVNPGKWEKPPIPFGRFYIKGNVVVGSVEATLDNQNGLHLPPGSTISKQEIMASEPFGSVAIPTKTAAEAYQAVKERAGCSFRRDTLDIRIVKDVENRTGKFIDVQGGFPHGTAYEKTLLAWPSLKAGTAPKDTDMDGMPDAWEIKKGLNPNNAKDGSLKAVNTHYTHIELYLNEIAP